MKDAFENDSVYVNIIHELHVTANSMTTKSAGIIQSSYFSEIDFAKMNKEFKTHAYIQKQNVSVEGQL